LKKDHVIICRGYADGRKCPFEGMFLRSYYPENHDGRGEVHWTSHLDQARSLRRVEAMQLFLRVPENHPVRLTDGAPNRPLTAFNIEIASRQDIQKEEEYGKYT
jgi:hypothetical protein